MLDLTSNPDVAANEMTMAREMADILHTTYPGYMWAVNVDRGLANVRNLMLSGNWGFVLKIPAIYSASEFRKEVIRAGGEILERYRLKRGQFDWDKYNELRKDVAGNPIADRD